LIAHKNPPSHKEILTPGNILLLLCDFTSEIKPKYLLLVSIKNGLLFFIINSKINQFKQDNPDLLESQVELKKDEHPFLHHDSWIDCSKVIREFDAAEVIRQVTSRIGKLSGSISDSARKQVRSVVRDSRTLEKRFKDAVLYEFRDC
jgi:hypothetical protein